MKKDHITKGDIKNSIKTTYIEHKHKNTGTSVLIHPINFETVSLKPSVGLSVEMWSWFCRWACFNWVHI